MIRLGSAKGSDRIMTGFTTVNMVAFAAMARATVRTTVAVKSGVRSISRTAYRMSPQSVLSMVFGRMGR
jgi:hypothetical protein